MNIRSAIHTIYQKCVAHKQLCAVLALILFSGLLLSYRLASRPLWMDEEAVLWYVHESPIEFVRNYIHVPDDHAPMYYFLVLSVYRALPYGVAALRLVSVLAAIGIVVTSYFIGLRVLRRTKYAFLASLAIAGSSFFLLIGQMARYHTVAAFGSVLALYFLLRILQDGYSRKLFAYYIAAGIFVCFNDYPHFVYLMAVTNVWIFFLLIRRKSPISLKRWLIAQCILAAAFLPMVLLILQRLTFSPELGFSHASLLGNSLPHIIAGILMHGYSFYFGENIFPWNIVPFTIGVVSVCAALWHVGKATIRGKDATVRTICYLALAFIVINSIFMNFVDPRYNFIVYPKFGFVAFPLCILLLFQGIERMGHLWARVAVLSGVAIVIMFGTSNFYQGRNYLNGSYFGTFTPYELVQQNAKPGDWLVINGEVNEGLYTFYANTYFKNVRPLPLAQVPSVVAKSDSQRFWFFSTGSDGDRENQNPEDKIPSNVRIVFRYDSTPLDPTLKKYKEQILGRGSYTYKYGLFLLTNR